MSADYFDKMYQDDPDPWRFATSPYEAEKYAATIAALPERMFAAGLEVGCSIGILTGQLASRCDALLALDGAEAALEQARARCPGVTFRRCMVPADWPPGTFDLIVFSEVLYYLDASDIRSTADLAMGALRPGGCLLLVHYLGLTDYPTTGDDAADWFIEATALKPALQKGQPGYRIDRLDFKGNNDPTSRAVP
jgi:SAM-dependent methyltransferase